MTARPGADRVIGVVMIALAMITALLSSRFDRGTLREIGPAAFPLLVSAGLAAIGAMLTARGSGRNEVPLRRRTVAILVAAAAFGFLIERVGLVASSFVVVVAASLDTARSRREALLFAALLSIGVAVIFVWLLQLPAPLWPGALRG